MELEELDEEEADEVEHVDEVERDPRLLDVTAAFGIAKPLRRIFVSTGFCKRLSIISSAVSVSSSIKSNVLFKTFWLDDEDDDVDEDDSVVFCELCVTSSADVSLFSDCLNS